MRDLTKSFVSFSWAMSMFGLRQAGALLSPQRGVGGMAGRGDMGAAMDAMTSCAEQQLGQATRSAFQAGDQLQRNVLDLMFSLLDPGSWNAGELLRRGTEVMQGTARAGMNVVSQAMPGAPGIPGTGQPAPSGWGPIPPAPKKGCGC